MNNNFDFEMLAIKNEEISSYTTTIDSLFVNGGSMLKCFKN